jgi:hypothetical protein
MKIFFAVLAAIIAILFAPMLLSPTPDNRTGEPVKGLPWQIEVLPGGGSRALGIEFGKSTLADVRNQYGQGELALVAAPGETESLEMFVDGVTLGGAIMGKLIARADLATDVIAGMRQRATKTDYMQSTTRKSTLAEQDLPAAWAAPVHALAFIPSANLTDETVVKLFGQPAERVRAGEKAEHLLYPDRGLGLTLDTDGKEVLQYVAPRDFASLEKSLKSPPQGGQK